LHFKTLPEEGKPWGIDFSIRKKYKNKHQRENKKMLLGL
jgi:hypothetical protein